MKKIAILLAVAGALALLLASACSDKTSEEACRYETIMNLDKGNYNKVLASDCADAMQLGAAWFGKAGFDIKDVINRMIDANDNTTTQSDMNIYMTALVSRVTETTFTYLDNAKNKYASVTSPENIKDAQFYLSLVDTMKGLALIKTVLDPNGDGLLSSLPTSTATTSCGNGDPNEVDEVEALTCALKVASNISTGTTLTCSIGTTYSPLTPVDMTISSLTSSYTNTYSGLVITLTGTPSLSCPTEFRKLLYKNATGQYWVATTLAGENCYNSANPSETWPCPLESSVDLVSAVDQSITSAIDSLSSSITTTTNTDVQQSINAIKTDYCCTDIAAGENTADPGTCACTSAELAAYLETI